MKRLLPHPILSLTLLLVWLLLNNDFSVGQLLLGTLLAWLIPLITHPFWAEKVTICKPLILLKFIFVVLLDIVIANFVVAKLILGSKQTLQPSFLEVPLELQNPLAIGVLANTITLTPGTVSCHLSADRKTLLVHALKSIEPDADIATIKQRYEQPLKEVFESCCK